MYDISLHRGVMACTRVLVLQVFSLMCLCAEQAGNTACTCFTAPCFVVTGPWASAVADHALCMQHIHPEVVAF